MGSLLRSVVAAALLVGVTAPVAGAADVHDPVVRSYPAAYGKVWEAALSALRSLQYPIWQRDREFGVIVSEYVRLDLTHLDTGGQSFLGGLLGALLAPTRPADQAQAIIAVRPTQTSTQVLLYFSRLACVKPDAAGTACPEGVGWRPASGVDESFYQAIFTAIDKTLSR